MTNKPKWLREGADNYETLYLMPHGVALEDEEGESQHGQALAHVLMGYDRTRFYSGRGGEGTSRPDHYIAYVRRDGKDVLVTEGADCTGDVGGLLNTKLVKAYRTLTAAKKAIAGALARINAKTLQHIPTITTDAQP